MEELAALAGMSPSSFREYFRPTISLPPLQFQKPLRLIEVRRLMIPEVNASRSAFAACDENVQPFTREYRRMFGQPPTLETATSRGSGVSVHEIGSVLPVCG